MVDDGGVLVAVGVTATKPAASCCVTVTLPVTATALAGMPPTPATCQVGAILVANSPIGRPTRRANPGRAPGQPGRTSCRALEAEIDVFHSAPASPKTVGRHTADGDVRTWVTPTEVTPALAG